MVLLPTVMMLKQYNNPKILHIEPTTACNAACPGCGREDSRFYNDKENSTSLTIDDVRNLNVDLIKNLDKMFMCGVFGDPAASSICHDIFKYFKEVNPTIELGMNTNGGLRSTTWWQELAPLVDYVVFSIDGLEDTNHLYRKNVKWSKVVENVEAFISAGGSAHWDMLIFDHNKHQTAECEQLARDMKFKWFRTKVSKRLDEYPIHWQGQLPDIKCHALKEQSLYLTATGELLPCCFFGTLLFTDDPVRDNLLQGDVFTNLQANWSSDPHPVCNTNCGASNIHNNFEDQWRSEIEL